MRVFASQYEELQPHSLDVAALHVCRQRNATDSIYRKPTNNNLREL